MDSPNNTSMEFFRFEVNLNLSNWSKAKCHLQYLSAGSDNRNYKYRLLSPWVLFINT